MAEKKYQVFISSTFADLQEERRKILDILLMADCIPAGMEAFVASDVEQFEVIKKVIQLCDYYILIIGKRYGSISPQTGKSYTEMEYEYAKELGIPVLVFALDESVEVPEEKRETDQSKIDALKAFRNNALNNRLATIWKTQDDLVGAVAISIMRATKEIDRPGWQRATEYDEVSLRREIMDLQKEKEKLIAELSTTKEELLSMVNEGDVAYESYDIAISYVRSRNGHTSEGQRSKKLPELFEVIALEMMDVAVTEKKIDMALRRSLFGEDSHLYSFKDAQFVKRLLAQCKALGLVSSRWSEADSKIFWQLTQKGEAERTKRIVKKLEA